MFPIVIQSFRYYWKSHLGLLLGAFLASAVLSGSLVVGDSVRGSLQRAAAARLGKVEVALSSTDRWFTSATIREAGATPLVILTASVGTASGEARANAVQVVGVEDTFWKLSPSGQNVSLAPGQIAINSSLAHRLKLKAGDSVNIRLEKPSAISRDAPLSGNPNEDVPVDGKIVAVLDADHFGAFHLTASQVEPDEVFLPLAQLSEVLGKKDRVNAALVGKSAGEELTAQSLLTQLDGHARLEDFGLKLAAVAGEEGAWDISTDRVFLDEGLVKKLGGQPATTYLINSLRSAKGAAPYSFVTATNEGVGLPKFADTPAGTPPPILVTDWLATDQNLKVGDSLELFYFVVGDERKLKETSTKFNVQAIVPMASLGAGAKQWTPDFPGVSEAKNCRDWQPGIPMKLDTLRPKDEDYWKQSKGTPKAFIPLSVGEKLWGNRFGEHTSVRIHAPRVAEANLRKDLVSRLHFADIGLVPRDVHSEANASAQGSVDFGGLFVGLSMFLIAGALIFAALLFLFTLEKRAGQMGLLLALGWPVKKVRRLILSEAGLVALAGSVLGILGGILYTRLALAGLNGAWSGATVGLHLDYVAQPLTFGIAAASSILTCLATLWLASRRIFKGRPIHLLAGEPWVARPKKRKELLTPDATPKRPRLGWQWIVSALLIVSAVGMSIAGSKGSNPEEIAGMFFGAGFCLLTAGILLAGRWMAKMSRAESTADSLASIGLRNVTRQPGRSLSVMGMMASGLFLVIAVNAFRLGAEADPTKRDSGTGGFALMGESTLPIYEDLNTESAWDAFALDDKLMKKAHVVPFRVHQGDDASCLNLNKAQNPVLMGVNPAPLMERHAFAFAEGSWDLLQKPASGDIPAVADQATAQWGLGVGIGDTLTYTDADGHPFKVRLVGLLAGSVLQGNVIVAEKDFLAKFPNAAGYRTFLVDAAPEDVRAVSNELTRQLKARGLALEPVAERLARFSAVQNTYIGIFTILGGLGVLLGTAGLGVLAARNILERRGEFALMLALGFRHGALRDMVLSEYVALLVGGMILGLLSAAIAVFPDVRQSGGALPIGFLVVLNAGILAFGIVVCWVAGLFALRGRLIEAVRRE